MSHALFLLHFNQKQLENLTLAFVCFFVLFFISASRQMAIKETLYFVLLTMTPVAMMAKQVSLMPEGKHLNH